MKPSEIKNISKLMEKRAKITDDLSMFLATSQVGALHMRHPKTFETNYDAELWKDQCNKLLDDIAMKANDFKDYLNNETNNGNIKSSRPTLSLKLISRHYTDDDMDHLNPGYTNTLKTKGSVTKSTRSSSSENERNNKNSESSILKLNGTIVNDSIVNDSIAHINDNEVKVEGSSITLYSKEGPYTEQDLLEELNKISDLSDSDLKLSDITTGSEPEDRTEYARKRNRKLKRKVDPVRDSAVNMRQFKRVCYVNLIRFDVNLYNEYIAKYKKYRLSSLTEFLQLTKKRKRSISVSSFESSYSNHSAVYYPEADAAFDELMPSGHFYDSLLTAYDQRPMNPEDEVLAAMRQISDSDMSGLDSDLDSDSSSKETKKSKVKMTKKKKRLESSSDMDSDFEEEIIKPSNSSWRRDPLLLENLDFDIKKTDGRTSDLVQNGEEVEPEEREVTSDITEAIDIDFVPSDDNSADTADSDIECLGDVTNISPGKGRKNIRAMLQDEALHEATQKANKLEQEKQKRLQELKNSVSSFVLSQSSAREVDGLVLDVDQESRKPTVVVNGNLTNRLKQHQQEGVKFMWNACFEKVEMISKNDGSGCILAHCMGLGKTFQVTTLVHTLFAHPVTNVKHVLIICPLSTVPNWLQEFVLTKRVAKCGSFRIFCKVKLKSNIRTMALNWRKQGGVLIIGYDAFNALLTLRKRKTSIPESTARALEEALRNPGPDLVVCDEGHLLKNQKKIKYKTVDLIKTRRRIILTGTPMQNNLTEYYYMVQLIKPNLLGTFKEFTNRFNNPIVNGQYGDSTISDIKIMKQRSHVLHEILKGTVQRYEESELNIYLPSKTDYALYVQMNEVQASLYSDVLNKLRSNQECRKRMAEFISHYQNLMPFWMHPCIAFTKENNKKRIEYETISPDGAEEAVINLTPDMEEKFPVDVAANIEYGAKFVVIMAIIEECMKVRDRLLIFSTSLFTLDAIEKFLTDANSHNQFQWIKNNTYFRLDGQVLPSDRVGITDKFNAKTSNAKLILMTNKVGGLGLNLVGANRVILADISWNPALDTQSIFRSYRFGQSKPVYIYRLIARGTMEETVYRRAVNKVAIAGRVVDEQQIDRHYKSVDVQEIYRFDYNKDEVRPIPKVPADDLLANLLQSFPTHIFGYDEHNSLFLNRPDEELNEEEMKEAWMEFNKERAPKPQVTQLLTGPIRLATEILKVNHRYLDEVAPVAVDFTGMNNRYLDAFLPKLVSNIPSHFLNANASNETAVPNDAITFSSQFINFAKQNTTASQSRPVISSASSTSTAPLVLSMLPPGIPKLNSSTNAMSILKSNKQAQKWLSKQMNSIPRVPLNILQPHRTNNVAGPQTTTSYRPIRRDVILNPFYTSSNMANQTVQATHQSCNNNLLNIANKNGPANGAVDLTLSIDEVTPVDTIRKVNPSVPTDSLPIISPSSASHTKDIVSSPLETPIAKDIDPVPVIANLERNPSSPLDWIQLVNVSSVLNPDVTHKPTTIEAAPMASDETTASVVEAEDFVVNPFLPAEDPSNTTEEVEEVEQITTEIVENNTASGVERNAQLEQ